MKNILSLVCLLLFASCATDINFQVPLTRFDTPETNGGFLKGSAGLNYGISHKVTTAEVIESMIPTEFGPSFSAGTGISKSKNTGIGISLGLLRRLDFIYKSHWDGANTFGAKFQFLGETAQEAKVGWKGSIQLSHGKMDEDQGTLNIYTNLGNIRHYRGHIKLDTYDTSLNFGYRYNKFLIAYFNSVFSYYDTATTMSDTGYSTKHVDGNVRSYGGLIGLRLGSIDNFAVLKVETGLVKSSWENQINLTSIPLGIGVDFTW